jgi:O-antigen/teichoic acid export membrane protein
MFGSEANSPQDKSMKNREALNSFVLGTRWMLVLSVLTLPVSYLNSLLLGRIAPKALGLYGLLVVSSSITALLMFGGGQTLIKFLPSIPANQRVSFVLTYGLLACGLVVPLLIAIGIKPPLLSFLVGRPLDPATVRYLLPFVPLILLTNLSRAILQARMEIKWMTIAGKLVPIISLAGFSTLFALQRYIPDKQLGEVILLIFCAAQLVSLLLAAYYIYARFIKIEPLHIGLFLPSGFWSFGLMINLSMIVVTILDNFDQALIFSQFEIGQLGIYRASLTTAEFVRWVPTLLTRSILPLFSHWLANDQQYQIELTYHRMIRYNTLAASVIALIIILFSHEILRLFGTEYTNAENILVLLAGSFVLSGISTINSSFIVAAGRVELGLVGGVIGSLLQIATSLMLIGPLGMEAAAIGKVLNLGCITVLEVLFVNRIAGLKLDRKSIGLLGAVLLAVLLSRFIQPESTVFVLAKSVVFLGAFAALALYWFDHDDRRYLRALVRGRFER